MKFLGQCLDYVEPNVTSFYVLFDFGLFLDSARVNLCMLLRGSDESQGSSCILPYIALYL